MAQQAILAVEHSPLKLEFIEVVLKDQGYEVAWATHGLAALEAVGRCRPDLILLDIQIPRIDGQELARRLKADPLTRRIPLVALTACAMTGDGEKTLDVGFDAYVANPINVRGFLGEVERHLRIGEPAGAA